jgi:hypothetical protein
MSNGNIKIVDSYRDSEDNEFFFRNDPFSTAGVKEILVWLEEHTDYKIIHIPHWQIQTKTQGSFSSYSHGIRIEK